MEIHIDLGRYLYYLAIAVLIISVSIPLINLWREWRRRRLQIKNRKQPGIMVDREAYYPTSEGNVEVMVMSIENGKCRIIWNEFSVDCGAVTGREAIVPISKLRPMEHPTEPENVRPPIPPPIPPRGRGD